MSHMLHLSKDQKSLKMLLLLVDIVPIAKLITSLTMKTMEVFTLPHIVRLDSTGLWVIFRSPPGVQVLFFLVGAQPNYGTNFTRSPGELTGVSGLQVPTTGIFPLFHPPGLHLESVHLDYNRHIYFNCIVLYLIVSNNNK